MRNARLAFTILSICSGEYVPSLPGFTRTAVWSSAKHCADVRDRTNPALDEY